VEDRLKNFAHWGLALVLLPLAACNGNPAMPLASTVPMPQTLPSVSAIDQNFIEQTASFDDFELRSAQLALDRSRNPRTRRFAHRILDDQTATGHLLVHLAQTNGITLPTAMGPEQARAYAAIANTRRIFDSEFFRQQAFADQSAITTTQEEIGSGYNNDVKAFARQNLPILRQHLQIAQAGRHMPMGRIPARRAVP
jgi:putative membrane protein